MKQGKITIVILALVAIAVIIALVMMKKKDRYDSTGSEWRPQNWSKDYPHGWMNGGVLGYSGAVFFPDWAGPLIDHEDADYVYARNGAGGSMMKCAKPCGSGSGWMTA